MALTTQFASDTVDLDVLASFSSAVKSQLPNRQRQPPAPPMREVFDAAQPAPSFEISFEPPDALPRSWFINSDGSRLVQLQGDRISLNWRRVTEDATYPRYVNLRRDFSRYLRTLQTAVEEADRQMPPVNMCEVTYVNPVEVPTRPKGGGHPELAEVLNRLRQRPPRAFLPHVEDAQLQARWRIPSSEIGVSPDRPVGRLYLAAQPGLKPQTGVPIHVLTVTARLMPAGGTQREAMAALDVGHRWVVLGFKDVTTRDMHKQWGLREES